MAATVVLTFDQLARWAAREAQSNRADFAEPIRECGAVALKAIHQGFAQSRAPDGSRWLPLKKPRVGRGGGSSPLLATGALRDSIQILFTPKGFEAYTNRVRAAVHQYGAIIRPRRAKALAIPLTAEAANFSSPRQFPRRLFVLARGNRAVLAERTGKSGRPKAQYALVRQVVIPARPFLGFSGETVNEMGAILADHHARNMLKRLG